MLRELHIKNVAVIEEVRVEFSGGFNALTGETGAGKSILIDSINMALGGRSSRDIIRSGCDAALVDLCFEPENPDVLRELDELGIDAEDGIVTISRRLGIDGKSVCRINGGIVPASVIRQIAPLLIDIHGQSDNQSLLSPKNHLKFLDEYGNLTAEVERYLVEYTQVKTLNEEIEALSMDAEEKQRRFEMLSFQSNEISAARLKVGEEEELSEARERLYNMESIISGASTAYAALYGSESGAAFDMLKSAQRALADICRFDEKLADCHQRLSGVIAEAEDIAAEVNGCLSGTDFNMAELDSIEERLDLIKSLKRKYGSTIEEIIEFGKNAAMQAELIEKSDERLTELRRELVDKQAKLAAAAEVLSKARKDAAEGLEEKISEELLALDMPKVRFNIDISERKENETVKYTQSGKDTVEFLISTNPGESLKPMEKIASGGELSRIMLAIKSVLSQTGGADAMIFDEIDTGVGGRAAQRIAEKISSLARDKQIFSITHLAQIAGMADYHYLIEKSSNGDRTATTVTLLSDEQRVHELARIIGGVTVTDLTLQSAEEMLKMARLKKGH